MIVSVARVYGWASPELIERLFFDAVDMHGLIYWYEDARQQEEQLKNA